MPNPECRVHEDESVRAMWGAFLELGSIHSDLMKSYRSSELSEERVQAIGHVLLARGTGNFMRSLIASGDVSPQFDRDDAHKFVNQVFNNADLEEQRLDSEMNLQRIVKDVFANGILDPGEEEFMGENSNVPRVYVRFGEGKNRPKEGRLVNILMGDDAGDRLGSREMVGVVVDSALEPHEFEVTFDKKGMPNFRIVPAMSEINLDYAVIDCDDDADAAPVIDLDDYR